MLASKAQDVPLGWNISVFGFVLLLVLFDESLTDGLDDVEDAHCTLRWVPIEFICLLYSLLGYPALV